MSNSITVTVNGKDFILSPPSIAWNGSVYFNYRSTRDGKGFGPVRTAGFGRSSAKSVGFQLAAAGREAFGDAMIAEARNKKIAQLRKRIADIDPAGRWAAEDLENAQTELAAVEANA